MVVEPADAEVQLATVALVFGWHGEIFSGERQRTQDP